MSPDAFFAWLDEETFIDDVKQQSKRRRSTSAPPPACGRKTHVKTNDSHNPSLEDVADKELKKVPNKRENAYSNDVTGRCRSIVPSAVEGKKKLTKARSEKQKSLKKAFAMRKRIGHMHQQELQQFVAAEERLVPPPLSVDGRKNLVGTNNNSPCKNSSLEAKRLEETLASVSQSHFMHFAADKELIIAPKKNASINDTSRGQSRAVPSFWQASDIVSSAIFRQQQRQHHHHQRRLMIPKKKLTEKRLRNTGLIGISSRTFDILPAGPLKHVSSFLEAPSRVIFDVALYGIDTKPYANESGGNQWSTLDFGEIEKSLAYKLRDIHIKAILLRIDAVNKLKRLKLTNCVEITGAGLQPLCGSRIIEQIDLSIVRNHWRSLSIPQIRYHHVVPILDSIIDSEGCALKHLQFPKVWRNDEDEFLTRYNEMLRNRGRVCCLKCNQNSYPTMTLVQLVQTKTCSNCLNHFCGICRNEEKSLRFCGKGCEKFYCSDCTPVNSCAMCKKKICTGCETETFTDCCASPCGHKICSGCVSKHISKHSCEKCKRIWCQFCLYSGHIKLHNVGRNLKQCTSCLRCACCNNSSADLHSCARCHVYHCKGCFGYSEEYWVVHGDAVCEGCEEYSYKSDNESSSSREESSLPCASCEESSGSGHGSNADAMSLGSGSSVYQSCEEYVNDGHERYFAQRYVVYGDAFTNAPICDM